MALLRAALAALCLAPWDALAAAESVVPVRICTTLPREVPNPVASHRLTLSLNVFAGTSWSTEVIRVAMREAATLLAQCGVQVARIEQCSIEAPRRFHFYSTPVSRELLRQLTVTKPAVFFVEDTRNIPAYDAEAIGRGNAATRPELADTIWIALGARDLPQTLAHELVHVLSDSGAHHAQPDNLMQSETSPQATRLTADQCARVLGRATANALLETAKP